MERDEGTMQRRTLAIIALVALVARLAAFAIVGPEHHAEHGYGYYAEMARNVVDGRGFVRTMPYGQGDRRAIRTPGYPLIVAAMLELPGALEGKVAIFGALCGAATAVLTALVAARAFGRGAGRVAGVIAALWPQAVVHDTALQDTALYSLLMLGAILLTMRLGEGASWPLALALGTLAGAGILVRVTLVLPMLALLAWLALRRRVRDALVAALVAALVLTPWLVRNARVVGAPVLTSDTGRSLWLGNNPQTFSVYPRQSIDRAEERAWAALSEDDRTLVRSLPELPQDAWFRARAVALLRERPGAAIAGFARKVAATLSPWMSPRAGLAKQAVHLVSWGGVLLLALVGAWSERRRWRELAPLWLPILLLALHSGVFFGHSAYRAYVDQLAIALAAIPIAPRVRLPRASTTWAITMAALALRLGALAAGGALAETPRPWEHGYEVGSVARSLADGRGFGDPFDAFARTGPSAAVGPLLPAAWSALLRVTHDEPLAWRLILIICAVSAAAVAALLAWGGSRLGAPRAGCVAAVAWAVHPMAVLGAASRLPTIFPLLATWALLAMLRLHARLRSEDASAGAGVGAGVGAGFAVGVGAWAEPLLLPAFATWVVVELVALRRRARAALVALVVALALVAPWMARNAAVMGSPMLRSWAGPELLLGATAGPGDPTPMGLHPTRNPDEMQRLVAMGEAAYVRDARDRAIALVREHPLRWVESCAWRWGVFWMGRASWWRVASHPLLDGPATALRGALFAGVAVLALAGLVRLGRRRDALAMPLTIVLALYPLPYALGHVEARYRLPLEPLLLLVAALAFVKERQHDGRPSPPTDEIA